MRAGCRSTTGRLRAGRRAVRLSKITDSVLEEVKAWQSRPLEEIYPIIYLDALVVKVRDGHQVRNRAAHIAVGVDLDGIKHVLGIWVQAGEGRPVSIMSVVRVAGRDHRSPVGEPSSSTADRVPCGGLGSRTTGGMSGR
jgi:hypothetical protein